MNIELISGYIENPLKLTARPDMDTIKAVLEQYPFFQSAHILYAIAINQSDSIFSNSYLPTASVYAGDRSSLYYRLNTEVKKAEYNILDKLTEKPREEISKQGIPGSRIKKSTDVLIEKFIVEKPSIQRPKADFFSPVEKASLSIQESEEFVSETLAKIYTNQQRYKKAIRIYEKLSLNYPEKSTYFALLIEHLKDKINE